MNPGHPVECSCYSGWHLPSCRAIVHVNQVTPAVPIEAERHDCGCISWSMKQKVLQNTVDMLILMACHLGHDVCANARKLIADNPTMQVRVSKPRKVPVVA